MKIHWTNPAPPELAAFPAAEQKRIWRECSRAAYSKGRTWLGLLTCATCAAAGSIIGDLFHAGIWGGGIGGGIGGFVHGQILIRSTLEVIRERYPAPEPGKLGSASDGG